MENKHLNNERELVRDLKKGNSIAFNTLFYTYSSKLYHFALSYLKSNAEAEELVQEVFLKIWEKKETFKEEYQFSSYLFTIAYNYIRKYFRSKALLNKYLELTSPDDQKAALVSPDVDYLSLKRLVDQLIKEMPEKRKLVFQKSRWEGKNVKTIAQEMKISQRTVENHLNLALKFLKQHLKNENTAGLLFFWLFLR